MLQGEQSCTHALSHSHRSKEGGEEVVPGARTFAQNILTIDGGEVVFSCVDGKMMLSVQTDKEGSTVSHEICQQDEDVLRRWLNWK